MEEINEQIINLTTKEWLDLQSELTRLTNLTNWLLAAFIIIFIGLSVMIFVLGADIEKLKKDASL